MKNNLAKHGNKQNSAHEESESKKQKQGLGAKRWEEDQKCLLDFWMKEKPQNQTDDQHFSWFLLAMFKD